MDLFHGLLRTISVGISDNPVVNMWQWHHNHLMGSYMKSYLNITDLPKDGCHTTTFDSGWNRSQIEGPLFSIWQFGLYVRIPRISYWIMTTVTIFFIETTGLAFGTMAVRLRPVWRQSWQMEPLLAVSCRLSPSRAPVPHQMVRRGYICPLWILCHLPWRQWEHTSSICLQTFKDG